MNKIYGNFSQYANLNWVATFLMKDEEQCVDDGRRDEELNPFQEETQLLPDKKCDYNH